MQIFEELGDRSGAAWSLNQQGDIAREQGDIVAARDIYQRALAAFRDVGNGWGSARSLADLGAIACQQGDYSAAHAAYRESLEIFAGLEHRRGMARVLEGLACLALAKGDPRRALSLAAAAAHARKMISASLPPAEQASLDQTLQNAWGFLGKSEGQAAWAEGWAMSLDAAIRYSLEAQQAATSH
jgi:tetratricopeptide (TPR) repeat protein